MKKFFYLLIILGISTSSKAQINDSGGFLIYEQAAYRVHYYDLNIQVFPESKSISGLLTMHAVMVHPSREIVLDLDSRLSVNSTGNFEFVHTGGQIRIDMGRTFQPGESILIPVSYGGVPREAPRPPWDGGFTWAMTPEGEHWIAVSCQTSGADLWWPVKDHPSDRPDSMSIHITIPEPLLAASNGRFRGKVPHTDSTSTWSWFVSTPINNYGVSINIAPYKTIEDFYVSTSADTIPVTFWVLPSDLDKGKRLFPQFTEHLRFYEDLLGPYPFRADKYGIVHTPYLGMEHQTIIAYGAGFRNDVLFGVDVGYDELHHHELGHEWWGNMVTVYDWKDFWIHEGICTYMQALFTEKLKGKDRYHLLMNRFVSNIRNEFPLAPRFSQTSLEMYVNQDVYFKGAVILHTLRYLVGDDDFFQILRRFAYPDEALEKTNDGSASRFATTDDFKSVAEAISGKDLSEFFEVYFRQPELPTLITERSSNGLTLRWDTPGNLPFQMPVEVRIGNRTNKVTVGNDDVFIRASRNATVAVDPNNWILKSVNL